MDICDKNPEFGLMVLSGFKVLDLGRSESTNQIFRMKIGTIEFLVTLDSPGLIDNMAEYLDAKLKILDILRQSNLKFSRNF
jgi:hypothetical protein